MTITTATWKETKVTVVELLELLNKAEKLNYEYCVYKVVEGFAINIEDKVIQLNSTATHYYSSYYSVKEINNFLDDRLKDRNDLALRKMKKQQVLQKLSSEEKELLGLR